MIKSLKCAQIHAQIYNSINCTVLLLGLASVHSRFARSE